MIHAPDRQRSALYRAEDRVPWGRKFNGIPEAQAFVDQVISSSAWEFAPTEDADGVAWVVPRVVVVRDGRGRRHACSERAWFGSEIKLPKWARTELIVLHELAHVRVPPGFPPHGARFAAEYLALVRRFASEDIADALEASFREEGVKVGAIETPRPAPSDASDPKKIVRLVRELRALSEGTDSPHEAAAAAARAQRLLLDHNLTVGDLDRLDEIEDPLVEHKSLFATGNRRVESWRQILVQSVAKACLCEWMTSFFRDPAPRTYSFIGRRSNVEVALYSYACLERQVTALADAERARRRKAKLPVKGYIQNYCEGVVHTIQQRLLAEQKSFEESDVSSRSVVEVRGREAESHRSRLYPHVSFTTCSYDFGNPAAYAAGRRDGNQVQLHDGVGNRSPRALRPPE